MRSACIITFAALSCACSWQRFDDVEDDSPVVSLARPRGMNAGFGVVLASVAANGQSRLLVGGAPGQSRAAAFDTSDPDGPSEDALRTSYCTDRDACFLSTRPAGLGRAAGSPNELCFAFGLGQTSAGRRGLLVRCEDDTIFSWPVPTEVFDRFIAPKLDENLGGPILSVLHADPEREPGLAVGLVEEGYAWYYPPSRFDPVSLEPGLMDPSFGRSVAVVRAGGTRVIAVGAPDEGHVWLFRDQGDGRVEPTGCLGAAPGFGRTLEAGPVAGDADDELVVADASHVTVFDGAALARLPVSAARSCGLGSLPAGGVVASLGCGTTPATANCEDSEFGAALAVGDFDGDGDGEVAVGAPALTVRGRKRAGAVLVYDVEADAPSALGDVRYVSSGEAGSRLGAVLAVAPLGERGVLAAGAPAAGAAYMFYCSGLPGARALGSRCD